MYRYFRTRQYDEKKHPFFNQEEIIFFNKWAEKVYDKNNPDDFNAKEYILKPVVHLANLSHN